MTTRQIAQSLFVTPKTVEKHISNTYDKLSVSSRGSLADALRPALVGFEPSSPVRTDQDEVAVVHDPPAVRASP